MGGLAQPHPGVGVVLSAPPWASYTAGVDGTTARRSPGRLARVLDVALIAGVVVVGWAGLVAASTDAEVSAAPFSVPMAVLAAVSALPLWWRRERPITMLVANLGVLVVASIVDERGLFPIQVIVEAAVLCFAIGAWSAHLRAAGALVAGVGLLLTVDAAAGGENPVAVAAYVVAVLVLPGVGGYASRARRQYLEEVELRLAEAERDRDARAREAVRDERTRIARELHDVVAHHVSLIGVQAGAARMSLASGPDGSVKTARATEEALAAIDESSRAAIGEMRQLLDALAPLPGDGPDGPGLAPQPSLDDLEGLAARWRDAGVPVALEVVGDPGGLTPALSLCCYRIVEEALTNVARHAAAPSARALVEVGEAEVSLEIIDPDPAASDAVSAAVPVGGAGGDGDRGRGLVGMRERVALFRGTFSAGPTRDRVAGVGEVAEGSLMGSREAGARPVRVVLCDDQPEMRMALRTIVEASGIEVVGEAGDGDAAVEAVRETHPDVVMMDVRMPGRDGLSATATLVREDPSSRVLILTTFDTDDVLFGALAAGASGFVMKNAGPEAIVRAVCRLAGGDAVLDPSVARRVFARVAPRPGTDVVGSLTERERDVLWLVAQGMTNAEVAARLGIGEETAKTHLSRVLAKLGVRDRVQAVIRGARERVRLYAAGGVGAARPSLSRPARASPQDRAFSSSPSSSSFCSSTKKLTGSCSTE